MAFKNLFSHPARNIFSVFSVMLAMALLTVVIAAQLRAHELVEMIKGRNNMIILAQGKPAPMNYVDKIKEVPGIKRVIYMWVSEGTSPDKKTTFLVHGTTADYTTISDSWFYIPPDELTAWESEKTGALVGRQTAKDLNLKVGSRVTIDTAHGPLPIVVSSVSPRGFKSTGVVVHHEYFTKLFHRENTISTFWAELEPGATVKAIGRQVDDMFRNSPVPTQSMSSSAGLKMSADAGSVLPTLITGAGLIILLATLLVTANTVAINVRSRVPELATLRALGFRRSKIIVLLAAEVLMICLVGGLLGSVLPVLLFRDGIDLSSGELLIGKVELRPELIGWGLLASAVLGVVVTLIPALRAARTDVATALRQV